MSGSFGLEMVHFFNTTAQSGIPKLQIQIYYRHISGRHLFKSGNGQHFTAKEQSHFHVFPNDIFQNLLLAVHIPSVTEKKKTV